MQHSEANDFSVYVGGAKVIELRDLQKKYGKKGKPVLKGASFSAADGEIVAILGDNGSGKTTMLKCILRLLEYEDGDIFYNDKVIRSIKRRSFYKDFSAVLEGNRNLYWYMSAEENIKYFGRLKGLGDKEIAKESEKYLKLLNLYDDKDKMVSEMSRGMQQKVAIIIALLGHPKVMLLDEPTLGLDVKSKNDLVEALRLLAKNEKITFLVTSHQLDVIDNMADRLVLLQDGVTKFDGKVMEFKEAYSQGKYIIRVKGEVKGQSKDYEFLIKDDYTDICLNNYDYDEALNVFDALREEGNEIILFQKDICSLEEILLNYKEKEK